MCRKQLRRGRGGDFFCNCKTGITSPVSNTGANMFSQSIHAKNPISHPSRKRIFSNMILTDTCILIWLAPDHKPFSHSENRDKSNAIADLSIHSSEWNFDRNRFFQFTTMHMKLHHIFKFISAHDLNELFGSGNCQRLCLLDDVYLFLLFV